MILGLLFLAPALLLLGLLFLRRYPGERMLLARIPRRRRSARPPLRVLARGAAILGRPGRLVAGRHEIRGPPSWVVLPALS